MNENEKNEQNVENPNANSKNNKRYKYKNRRRKLADSLEIEGIKNSENAEQAKPNEAKKKKRNHNLPSKLTGNEDWQIALAECIDANRVSHETRLNPLKYNNSSEHKIRITPLGGLGEIGGNISVFETNNDAIIIDLGMSFPDGTMHGVDIIIPDFDYVRKIKDKIRGIVITHAHEDHIGAVPYFFK